MALPDNITTITVTGKFLNQLGGPASGTVSFTPASTLTDTNGEVILTGQPAFVTLDDTGAFSVVLPCTDNDSLRPSPFYYTCTIAVPYAAQNAITFTLPSTLGDTVDISALVPIPTQAAAVNGIYVSSVNGQSGSVNLPELPVPIPVQGASYTATGNTWIPVDASSGSRTIILPANQANLTTIGVALVRQTGTNTVTVETSGGATFNDDGTTSYVLAELNQGFLAQYYEPGNVWYIQADISPSGQFLELPSGTAEAGQVPIATGAGQSSEWGYVGPGPVQYLTYANPTPVNAEDGNDIRLTITASNYTIDAPANPVDGQVVRFHLTQNSSGNHTVVWGTGFINAFQIETTAQPYATDIITFIYDAGLGGWVFAGQSGSYQRVLRPSGDTTGATDTTNIVDSLNGFPRRKIVLGQGTFYINAGLAPINDTWLAGSGKTLTTIKQASGFTGTYMILPGVSGTISDLSLAGATTTTTSNPQADGIYITQNGNYLSNTVVRNVGFYDMNGWAVHIYDDGTHGAPVGMQLTNLLDGGGNAGGVGIFGAQRTMGIRLTNANINANGGTSTTLDSLYMQDVFDAEIIGAFNGTAGTCTGNGIHLVGHCNNMRFTHGEVGATLTGSPSGRSGVKIENGANGTSSQIHFLGVTFQTFDYGADLEGSCTDISFTDCEFNTNNSHGTVVNTSGAKIDFTRCNWAAPGSYANNGQAGGTVYDLDWSGTGTGTVAICEFSSSIVASGAGVTKSVNIAAGQNVEFDGVKFTGAGASSANWFTNLPALVRETGSGWNYAAGTVTLATPLAATSGGTGAATAAAGYNALSPMTTRGDIEYESAAGTASRLAIGSGNEYLGVVSGVPAWVAPSASASFTPSNPSTTTSTTLVMMGFGYTGKNVSFTPALTGKVLVVVSGVVGTDTAFANVVLGGRYGSGAPSAAPQNGAAVTGTMFGGSTDQTLRTQANSIGNSFSITQLLTLTPATQYWFDLTLDTNNASDAAYVQSVSFSFAEMPS